MSETRTTPFDPNHNMLAHASSPYLRQHTDNPVHWQQWCPEAFEYALEHDLVVFVSVGYSTCHWCHVMAGGAFSNPAVTDALSRGFVSIKVDREERPDIDSYLMSFLVETTGQGGWPLNAFLSPRQEIFFAMTYAPAPDDPRAGSMMSFDQVLSRVRAFYDEKKDKLGQYEPAGRGGGSGSGDDSDPGAGSRKGAGSQTHAGRERSARQGPGAPGEIRMGEHITLDDVKPGEHDIDRLTSELSRLADTDWAGFGPGPKFPPHSTLLWMLHAHAASGDLRLADMSRALLDRMASRGLHDHLQGGFFRYCVDREWTIPHFEKMLYDQALLLWNYAAAAYHFDSPEYERVAEGVVRCLEETFREDTHGLEGTLYVSAHDADTDHEEGATYLWSESEIRSLLSEAQWEAFRTTFELPEGGNFEGKIHLVSKADYRTESRSDPADPLGEALETLCDARAKRRQPFVDTKVVTSWNALAATALVVAGRLLDRPEWSARGEEIADELTARHDDGSSIVHASLGGEAGSSEFLSDYSALMLVYTVLAEADGSRLTAAEEIENRLSRFRTGDGGWIESAQEDFRAVPPDTFDHPLPSSPALLDLARARYAMMAHVPWEQTEPGRAAVHDFHNLAALARAGLFYIVESHDAPRWREAPLNAIWTGGEALRHCYAGSCRPGLPGAVESR